MQFSSLLCNLKPPVQAGVYTTGSITASTHVWWTQETAASLKQPSLVSRPEQVTHIPTGLQRFRTVLDSETTPSFLTTWDWAEFFCDHLRTVFLLLVLVLVLQRRCVCWGTSQLHPWPSAAARPSISVSASSQTVGRLHCTSTWTHTHTHTHTHTLQHVECMQT